MTAQLETIAGLVLAGGRSSRFGGADKAFQKLGGKTLFEHTARLLKPLSRVAISSNRSDVSFDKRYQILADIVADGGALGGIHAGLTWAASLRAQWLVSVPIDLPFLPDDFVQRLASGATSVVAIAATQKDFSPVAALWNVSELHTMTDALARGVRKMTEYLTLVSWQKIDMGPASPIDPLFNINTPERLAEAERLLPQLRRNRGA